MGVRGVLLASSLLILAAGCIQADDANENDDGAQSTPSASAPTMPAAPACEPPVPPAGTPTIGPEQGGATNQPGSFAYSGQTAGKTGTEAYEWENPSGAAQISWGGQALAGSVTLTIQDACGMEMYEKTMTGPDQGGAVESTDRATPGKWLLVFDFAGYTAQMGLSITSA